MMQAPESTLTREETAADQAPASENRAKAADEAKAAAERLEPPASRPGGFDNDPPDPANPNEVIERHRQKLRP